MTAVAKRKAKKTGAVRDEMIAIRCSKAFKDHVEKLASLETRQPTQLIERALKEYAAKYGYDPFPER